MTQSLATYDNYIADFLRLQERDGNAPAWLRDLRREAFERFRETGLPAARKGNEPWKYTNIAPIAGTSFAYPFPNGVRPALPDVRALAPWHDSWATLVFVNGRHAPELSRLPALGGVRVTSLARAAVEHEDVVRGHLARHASFKDGGFTALNTAFLQDGAFIEAAPDATAAAPLHLVFLTAGGNGPLVSHPRTLVVAGRDARLTVIESYLGAAGAHYLSNPVSEIVLGEGAQVDHYRLMLDGSDAYHVGLSRVYQQRDSTFTSMTFAAGPALGRNDFAVLLDAPGASCFLRGLYVTSGSQHIDNYINIDHAQPHTTSRLYYRGILDDSSRAVFGGMVLVREGAVKADAYQEDKNLLLSDKAEVDSKPSLEIYADDVKCGHGATAGAIADDAMFYMRSRGLDEKTAQVFLVKGFANEILDEVRPEPLREWLERRTLEALPHFGAAPGRGR